MRAESLPKSEKSKKNKRSRQPENPVHEKLFNLYLLVFPALPLLIIHQIDSNMYLVKPIFIPYRYHFGNQQLSCIHQS